MPKAYTAEDFDALLIADFTWRLKELSALKLAISTAGTASQAAFVRSLVAMCYAHWEGHARFCAEAYLEFLVMRRLRFVDLVGRFYQVRFFKELSNAHSTGHKHKLDLVQKILSSSDERFSYFPRDLIDTRSNLNSSVLSELCLICDLDYSKFEDEEDFLDRLLLKRRNEVAHGEAVFIDAVDGEELVVRTLSLMRIFRDEIDNKVSLQLYRAL